MTEIHVDKSDSDLSSDSWSLLDEKFNSDEDISDLSDPHDEIIAIGPEVSNEKVSPAKKPSDCFLTFDEYLQERLLQHDYDLEEKPRKLRKLYREKIRKGFKRCKPHSLGISVFITIILGLSAFATLCSTLSQPLAEKEIGKEPKKEAKVMYNNLIKPLTTPKCYKSETFVNATIEKPRNFTTTKILGPLQPPETDNDQKPSPETNQPDLKPSLAEIKIEKTQGVAEKPVLKPPTAKVQTQKPGPDETKTKPDLRPSEMEEKKRKVEEMFKKFSTCDPPKASKVKAPRSKWMVLKDFLLDTNFQALLSLFVTNVYLFALLVDCLRNPSEKKCKFQDRFLEDLEDSSNIEEMRKYLFKELPFWNSELVPKPKSGKKKISKRSIATAVAAEVPQKAASKAGFGEDSATLTSVTFKTTPFLSEHAFSPIVIPPTPIETGKSECQRRFEELDQHQKKFENLKQAQRHRVRLLKQKYKNQVALIKDTVQEATIRNEKINRTSQMFIQRLKFNREKYLLEVKKVKDLRQRAMEANKKDCRRDVAVGSYSVSLPPIYDYGERFRMIKKQFEHEAGQIPKEFKLE